MAKWYSEMYPESSKISTEDYLTRKRIEDILATFTQEMEGYSYFGSNPGIKEDDYDDVAEAIMIELGLWEAKE